MGIHWGYKAVESVEGQGLVSCIIRGPYWVRYPVEEWVAPNLGAGPLCVFRDWHSARYWFQDMRHSSPHSSRHYRLFRCEYEESDQDRVWVTLREPPFAEEDRIRRQEMGLPPLSSEVKRREIPLVGLERGTVLASRVWLHTEVLDFREESERVMRDREWKGG